MGKKTKKRPPKEVNTKQQPVATSSQTGIELGEYAPAVPLVSGRKSDLQFVVAIWKCILNLKSQDIRTSVGAVKAEMHKEYRQFSSKFDCSLRFACEDKLVVESKVDGVTVLEVPGEDEEVLTHEMHCYTCFQNGEEMWECRNCHRVYHETCFHFSDVKGHCFHCKPHIQERVRERTLTKVEINDLLSIMYYKIGLPNGFLDVVKKANIARNEKVIGHLVQKLLFRYNITNTTIQLKLEKNDYKCIKDCVRDYRQLMFNICVFYGTHSDEAKRAQIMFNFVQSEASYMHNCFDCYVYYAHDKSRDAQNIWFLMPCNPPHEIVFAKFKTFAPSPAKIIRSDKDQSYVWFFGEHEVAWVHKADLSPTLTVKEPISHKLKLALIEMEKYKLIASRYKNGKIDFKGIPRLRKRRTLSDSE